MTNDAQLAPVIALDADSTGSSWIGARVAVVRWSALTAGGTPEHALP